MSPDVSGVLSRPLTVLKCLWMSVVFMAAKGPQMALDVSLVLVMAAKYLRMTLDMSVLRHDT